ncbi:MAG: hypothetical protein WAL66_17330 [Nitrososphaeraceae archaeon]
MRRKNDRSEYIKETRRIYSRFQILSRTVLQKTLADIDINPEDNSQMIAIITSYLGMKPKEVKMLFKSRRKSGEAWKLDQMAWVAKRCLIVKT